MRKQKINLKGFTLIEVLVTVAVVGIMMTLSSVIFINTIRNSKKSEITAEARENAALVIDRIQRDGREASSLTIDPTGTILNIDSDSGTIQWKCVTPGSGNRSITRTGTPVTNKNTVTGVSWSSCSFSPTGTTTNLAKIDVTLTEGSAVSTGPQEYGVNLQFSTSIATRSH